MTSLRLKCWQLESVADHCHTQFLELLSQQMDKIVCVRREVTMVPCVELARFSSHRELSRPEGGRGPAGGRSRRQQGDLCSQCGPAVLQCGPAGAAFHY